MAYGGQAAPGPVYIVRNGALVVPVDYVGMHFRAWPIFDSAHWAAAAQPYPGSPSSAPLAMAYGSYRTHDSVYAWWHKIETSQGVYNWGSLDTLISTHRAAGKSVTFCMYGVPNFYLADGNPNKNTVHATSSYPDGTSPNGITGLTNFISALVTRYNTAVGGWALQANGGGTNWSVIGKGLQYLELWNEPEFDTTSGFWVGSVGQFVDLCHAIRTAAKSVDPSLPVNSPGFSGMNWLQQFLLATGIVNAGVTGLSVSDAVCFHYYTTMPPGFSFGSWTAANYKLIVGDASLKAVLGNCGASGKAVYVTETGFDYTAGTAELTAMMAQSPQWRYEWWARLMLTGAALGYKSWATYAWDTPYSCYPNSDPSGVARAVNDVHLNVAGKTIRNAYYYSGGPVTLEFSDGSSFTA